MKGIPVHQLRDKTNTGLEIKAFTADSLASAAQQQSAVHRDDHYIFFLLTEGEGSLTVDLSTITVHAGQLYYICPSQVHLRITPLRARGWFLAIDTALMAPEVRDVLEHQNAVQQPCTLSALELKQYSTLLPLLQEQSAQSTADPFHLSILHPLVYTFLAMAARSYSAGAPAGCKYTRSAELAGLFKNLLAREGHSLRTPAAYASALNVSLGHLNQSVKKLTGSTVSYWIQQEIFTEARRLLYHSTADLQQIARELGFSDYSYFSRSFRKSAGMSPSAFRTMHFRKDTEG